MSPPNQNLNFLEINTSFWETMNYFTHIETPGKGKLLYTHAITYRSEFNWYISQNTEYRSTHFVNFLCNWTFVGPLSLKSSRYVSREIWDDIFMVYVTSSSLSLTVINKLARPTYHSLTLTAKLLCIKREKTYNCWCSQRNLWLSINNSFSS